MAEALPDGAPEDTSSLDSAAYDDLLGKTIANNFHIVRRIGSGGMGRVYEAEQLSLGKRVAIKILRREFMQDERVLTRFELEARAASAINHPNLVQIFDCGRDPELDVVYIAMELLPGRDLSQLIAREWPLPLQRVVHIIDDVLAALDEAHAQGIVHRDLKPGNIMLVPRRNQADLVKVLDFGIAKAPQSRGKHNPTMAGFVFGTPEYMAPEQARGANVDGRTDLYAVAAILYQLLTGDIPLPAATPPEILARLLRDEPERPSATGKIHLPEAFEDLLMRGLAKEPEERPQTASQFRDELRASLVGIIDWWPGQTGGHAAAGPITPPPSRASGSPVTSRPVVNGSRSLAGAPTPPPRAPGVVAPPAAVNAVPVMNAGPGMNANAPLGAAAGVPTSIVAHPAPKSRTGLVLAVVAILGGGGFLAAGQMQALPPSMNPFAKPGDKAALKPSDKATGPGAASAPATAPHAASSVAATSEAKADKSDKAESPEKADKVEKHETAETAEAADNHNDVADSSTAAHAKKSAPNKGRPEKTTKKVAQVERHATTSHGEGGAAGTPAAAATTPAPTTPAAVAANEEKPAAESHPTREEPMKEAERLLGQGEVEQACRKGEEARRATPKTPAIYKFLGKCYMRAGKASVAQDNYRKYLELAPDAPDGAFIRSYVK